MQNNNAVRLANMRMLEFVATKLGDLRDEVVFLGGCTTALLIDDPYSPDVRHTFDVDCIVDVISLREYHHVEKKLRALGFKQSLSEEVICRWRYDHVILDVMPTDEKILGFGNRWYKDAISTATIVPLTSQINIKVVAAPYFLATKLEAFKTRGNMDFYASHDFEDIVSVLDGCTKIVEFINQSDKNLKNYLIKLFSEINNNRSFHGALPGHFVQYGRLAEDRIEMLEEKMKKIIAG